MPSAPTHRLGGAVTAWAIAERLDPKHERVANRPAAAILGTVLATLPDRLEPATGNPHHRQFFHSVALAAMIAYGMKRCHEWEPEKAWRKSLRWTLLIGGGVYLSHLALDALTPRSLPHLGRL